MAQIKTRYTQTGDPRFTAYIRKKRKGVVIHDESQTFPTRPQAVLWAKRREVELAEPDALAVARMGERSIGALIKRYIEEFEQIEGEDGAKKWGRTKSADLRKLLNYGIANHDALALTSSRLVDHIKERRAEGVGPATALNDLVWLGVVLRTARGAWDIPAKAEAVAEAREACRGLRLTAKSNERDRTPTYEELEKLDGHFKRQDAHRSAKIPMRHIMWFAIYSSRRESEICRLRWADNEDDRRLGLMRDVKHPEGSKGNHRTFRYTPRAWQIMRMQPKGDDVRIFPYNPRSVCARFTKACKLLGIEDLHFHDLRRESVTRLFEQSLTIPEVAAHSLHESWAALKTYTNLVRRGRILDAPFLTASSSSRREPPRGGRLDDRPSRPKTRARAPSGSRNGKRVRASR